MPPKKGASRAPRSLNRRLDIAVADGDAGPSELAPALEEVAELLLPSQGVLLSWASVPELAAALLRSSSIASGDSVGFVAASGTGSSHAFRDPFQVGVEPAWMRPPLAQYCADERLAAFWREPRTRERLQLGYAMAGDEALPDSAWMLWDLLHSDGGDWPPRVKLAAAAVRAAELQLGLDPAMQPVPHPKLDLKQGISAAEARWMRACLLLVRVLRGQQRTLHEPACYVAPAVLLRTLRGLVSAAPGDPFSVRFALAEGAMHTRAWAAASDWLTDVSGDSRMGRPATARDTFTMEWAYVRLFSEWQAAGPDSDRADEAFAAVRALDPNAWVPLLLVGAVLRPPNPPPVYALGSKDEAAAVVHQWGLVWVTKMLVHYDWRAPGSFTDIDPFLAWMLEEFGLEDALPPGDKLGYAQMAQVEFNIGASENAWNAVIALVQKELAGAGGVPLPHRRLELLRADLTLLCVLAEACANLPPVDAACNDACYKALKDVIGDIADAAGIKLRLSDCASTIMDQAGRHLAALQALAQRPDGAAAAGLQLTWPGELAHAARTLAELAPARVRWLWQIGEVRQAKEAAADLLARQRALHKQALAGPRSLHSALRGRGPADPGPVLFSLTACEDMLAFLTEQSLAALRSKSKAGGSGGLSMRRGEAGAGWAVAYSPLACLSKERVAAWRSALFAAAGGEQAVEAWLASAQLPPLPEGNEPASGVVDTPEGGAFFWRLANINRLRTGTDASEVRRMVQQVVEARAQGVPISALRQSLAGGAARAPAAAAAGAGGGAGPPGVGAAGGGSGGGGSITMWSGDTQITLDLPAGQPAQPRRKVVPVRQRDQELAARFEFAPPAAAGAGAGSSGAAAATSASGAASGAAGAPAPAVAAAAAAEAAPPARQQRACAACGAVPAKLLRCARCHAAGVVVGYCSARCQATHWKAHKRECGRQPAAGSSAQAPAP